MPASRIKTEYVSFAEKWIGFMLGPSGAMLITSITGSYMNVYFTDVLNISGIWNGMFLGIFPFVSKIISIASFFVMGYLIDRTCLRHGKARPWILLSAPLLTICTILGFAVPQNCETVEIVWIFVTYSLLFGVVQPMYSASHTLLVPLSTRCPNERSTLSMFSGAHMMIAGTIVALIFPGWIIPAIGVSKQLWIRVMTMFAVGALPLMVLEYLFTRERITEESKAESLRKPGMSFLLQLKACLKSRAWLILMLYIIVLNASSALSGASIFYYCNWVLGSYNDGITQVLFYALGNAPLGLGLFLSKLIYKKIGRRNAMIGGYILAFFGVSICMIAPYNLPVVLIGQAVKSLGLIPSTYIIPALLADALDDVEEKSGYRCDGFSSSVFNTITAISSGVALSILNFGLSHLGYAAPAAGEAIPVQNLQIRQFFIFGANGCLVAAYPVLAFLLVFFKERKYSQKMLQ